MLRSHECAYAPDPVAKKDFDAIGMGFLPCPCRSIKTPGRLLRESVKSAVQNALNQKQPPLHVRAYALTDLLMRSHKRGKWLRDHPEQKDALQELIACCYDSANLRFLRLPANAIPYESPGNFPELALTPHGVELLADILTSELIRRKMARQAKDEVRKAIAATLRGMHDECNAAFVQRIEYANQFRRVDVTEESVPVKSAFIRRHVGTETARRIAYTIRKRSDPRPEGARDADTFHWLNAMLWDQWDIFGMLSRQQVLAPTPVEYPEPPNG
ncbi:MAG: hypothetical protein WCB99_06515 [Candidatus Cybelea sp.]